MLLMKSINGRGISYSKIPFVQTFIKIKTSFENYVVLICDKAIALEQV